MTPNEYQRLALRTANNADVSQHSLANWCMGLAGEAGEVVDYLKKVVFHGHKMDPNKVQKELGDVLWYVAVLSSACGLSLEDVMGANIAKLRERYPEGFTSKASVERKAE